MGVVCVCVYSVGAIFEKSQKDATRFSQLNVYVFSDSMPSISGSLRPADFGSKTPFGYLSQASYAKEVKTCRNQGSALPRVWRKINFFMCHSHHKIWREWVKRFSEKSLRASRVKF